MPLAVQPVSPIIAAIAAEGSVALQPGTVVDAQVLQVLSADLVRIAIANLTLDVSSVKPLQPGQTLQLAVAQTAQGLSLTPVAAEDVAPQRAAAVIVDDIPLAPRAPSQPQATTILTVEETRMVTAATQAAVTRQAGLSQLFADLSAAADAGRLPQPVQRASAALLGLRIPADAALTGADVKAAVQASGLTMEAAMASPPAAAIPDLKATLLVLRQALATWVTHDGESVTSPQVRSGAPARGDRLAQPPSPVASEVSGPQAARVIDALARVLALPGADVPDVPSLPAVAPGNLLAAQVLAGALRDPSIPPGHSAATPPPVRGEPPAAQPVASPSLAPDAEPKAVASRLLAETDGALARQTLLQIASLPDRTDMLTPRIDAAQPRWNFEIPFVTPQGTAMAQFEITRDGGSVEADAAQRVWRARFSLDVEPAGPIHALIAFGGDTTSVKMWAERPTTAAQLRANASELSQSLGRAELKPGDIVVADGAPARGKVASGHFLNRAS